MSGTLTINSNLASLNAQRRLASSTAILQKSFERLSSGLRINHASDDAAGLAIASSLNNDARVYSQAARNANDVVSFYSIAEGALHSLVDIATRLKELAQQSSNGVLSTTQRKALDAEGQAIAQEYRRITWTTQFNGRGVFDYSNGPLAVQVGYDQLTLSAGTAADGTFAAPQTVNDGGAYAFSTADVNGDGNLDIISTEDTTNQVNVLLGNGDGRFKAPTGLTTGLAPTRAVTADLNGDGKLDIISANNSQNTVGIFLGNGDGQFKAMVTYSGLNSAYSIATGDYTGDGITDLLVSSTGFSANTVNLLAGNSDGSFKAGAGVGPMFTTGGTVTSADFNGDGFLDFIADSGAATTVFLGTGSGTFYNKGSVPTFPFGFTSTVGDINGDGRIDVVAASFSSFAVFLGNGDGTFVATRSNATTGAAIQMQVVDLNSDGKSDVLITTNGGNQLSVYLGNSDGTFNSAVSYATGTNPAGALAVDLNKDGILDIVAGHFSGEYTIHFGNGISVAAYAPTVETFSLITQQSSRDALTQFGTLLNNLSSSVGQLGANESRLSTITNVLQVTRQNYIQAASQIQDVDVAQESAALTKTKILQQAGAAILAQANQQPTLALSLLRNI